MPAPPEPVYDIEVVSSVTDIPKQAWDDLAPADDPLWRWSYFRVMEESDIGPDGFEYFVFRRDGRVVAILPAFWFNAYPLSLGLGDKLDNAVTRLRRFMPSLFCLPVYFCGHPMGEGRILRAQDEPFAIGRRVLESVRNRAWAKDLSWIIFKDFSEPSIPTVFPAVASSSFFAVPGLPDARLELPWSSFEDYVGGGRSNAKRNIRKRLRKFAKLTGLRVEVLRKPENRIADMMPLYRRVMARTKVELEHLTPAYFAALSTAPDIEKEFVVCFDGDRLVGFVLCLFAGAGAVCLRGGFDYETSRESGAYFVLQYACIRLAILAGCREMSFCQTTYQPKLALGCRLTPLTHVATHRSALLRPLVRRLLPLLFSRYSRICGLDRMASGQHA